MTDTQQFNPQTYLSQAQYLFMKSFVQLYLPGFATLYLTLASIWGLPAPEAVTATAVAVATFLGIVLKISTANFYSSNTLVSSDAAYDGKLETVSDEGGVTGYSLNLDIPIEDIPNKTNLNLKID